MELAIDLTGAGIDITERKARRPEAFTLLYELEQAYPSHTGWVTHPFRAEAEVEAVQEAARKIRETSDVFLVLGVGGSFVGAKALIDLIHCKQKLCNEKSTKVIFAGYNFSGRYAGEVIETLQDKDFSLAVVSKSGSTVETLAAFGIFRTLLQSRYGPEEAAKRTYYISEKKANYLSDLARAEGSPFFEIPENIGGRYSALSPVGLLPVAVHGGDPAALLEGARKSRAQLQEEEGLDYAICRQALAHKGKNIEVFEFYDPYAAYLGEWLKQLFGESEGKAGRGIFPTSLLFSRDLHSMGQFLQQGSPCFFETLIHREKAEGDQVIPRQKGNPYGGMHLEALNTCARRGVMAAHRKAGIPLLTITLPGEGETSLGALIYWFEIQCAVSALLSGVHPFDQPGVEAYKKEMKAYMGTV